MRKLLFAILVLVPTLAFAQRYHIGDTVYSPTNEKAVVFYVFDDGNHGWAVSLRDLSYPKYWSSQSISANTDINVESNTFAEYGKYLEDVDGWLGNKGFRDYIYDLESCDVCETQHVFYPTIFDIDFDNGWYLPTAGQMRKLYSSKIYTHDVIVGLGGSWLKAQKYWTYTIPEDNYPVTMNGNTGIITQTYHDAMCYLRPIRNVGFVSDITKDKYYCRGDKVVDLGYDFFAENDTLISRTYTSYQGFDSIVRVNVHVLEPEYALEGNMLVCMELNTEISVTHGAGSFTYSWRDEQNPNMPIGTESSLTLTNVTEGHPYSVMVGQYFEQVERYCSSSQSFDISVIETDVAISGGGIVCYNTSETLSVPEDENLEYVWYMPSNPANHLGTGSTFTTANLTAPTTYAVSVSGGACTGTGSITVNVAPQFSVSISGDNDVCYGENATLLATPSNSEMVTYSWYNAENNAVVGTENTISTAALYENTQFGVIAVKTSGIAPSSDNVFVGDIVTSNNIVVRPSQWMEAEIQNLEAIGVVYSTNADSVRVVSLDEYASIPWGTSSFTTGEYAATYTDARTKMNGKAMTDALVAYNNSRPSPADADYIAALKARTKGDDWYLPAEGELYTLATNITNVNYAINILGGTEIDELSRYWSVTEKDENNAWCSLGTATASNSKTESHIVRPVIAFRYSNLIGFRNSATCRANDTHNVAVTPQQIGNTTATIELGQSFTYRDSTIVFNDAGEFDLQWTFHNNGGCDSIINISIVVTPTTITVTPLANQSKNCGQTDPTLQYSLSENINVSGELSREEGESVGTYNYTLGTLEGGDNYELVLAENSPMFEILPLHTDLPPISMCNSYDWHGNTYTLSGDYTDTLQTATGCDSIVTLHLTIHSSDTTYIYDTVCYEYVWQSVFGNVTYTESGEYTRRFYSTTGCDSIVTLRLYVTGDQIDIYAEACGSYLHNNGYTYYESGDWPRGYMSEDGCYITETLHLTIHPYPQVPVVSTTPNTNCSGSGNGTISVTSPVGDGYEYSLDGENFQESPVFENLMEGDYIVTVSNGMCQKNSEATIGTTVVRPEAVARASTTMVCNGGIMILTAEGSSTGDEYTYSWSGTNGFSSTEDYIEIHEATSDDAGEYSLTVTNTETGCDKTVSITVAVNEATFGTDVVTACDSYTWIDEQTYTESTTEPIFVLENANGCDSIVTLNLTILHSVAITEEVSICPSELPYEYNGEQYTEAGTYEIFLETENHCDSIVTLVLNVYEGAYETINVDVCEYDMPYIFDDSTLNETGTYTFVYPNSPCDSVVTVVLNVHERPEISVSQTATSNEITITAEGASNYLWENGETSASITIEAANDTLWVIGYSEYQCTDTAEVIINDLSSVNGIETTINVYPVPSNGIIFVEGDNINSLEVLDISGKLIKKSVPTSTVTEIDMDVPSGEYMLRIETTNGILTHKILVIK